MVEVNCSKANLKALSKTFVLSNFKSKSSEISISLILNEVAFKLQTKIVLKNRIVTKKIV